ncbi:MAG TPA: hypothetical protein VN635_01625 [Conexibacter sp.]|nr:hypothetical protein [Conexibacter sp.]
MRNRGAPLATVLLAVMALMVLAGGASANRGIALGVSEGELGRVQARSSAITFTDATVSFRITCEVTGTLRLNSSIAKTAGAAVGTVTEVTVRNCIGGGVRMLTESIPWRVNYVSFSGTLPNIREVRVEIVSFALLIESLFGTERCLFIGNAQETTSGNPINSMVFDETVQLPFGKNLGLGTCPSELIINGSLTLRPVVQMRLI